MDAAHFFFKISLLSSIQGDSLWRCANFYYLLATAVKPVFRNFLFFFSHTSPRHRRATLQAEKTRLKITFYRCQSSTKWSLRIQIKYGEKERTVSHGEITLIIRRHHSSTSTGFFFLNCNRRSMSFDRRPTINRN
jgi:hypothetical protein